MALALVFACDQVDVTAPSGSSITLTASPLEIPANGSSMLTVTGSRGNGAPLQDGIVVRFTVTEKSGGLTSASEKAEVGYVIPNPVETKDGLATSKFYGGSRSGTAVVKASSATSTSSFSCTPKPAVDEAFSIRLSFRRLARNEALSERAIATPILL